MIIKDILKMLKVNHYIKNIVVFVPLIFSMNFANAQLFLQSLLMFIAFCLMSSTVYIMNDLFDIEDDRKHPVKCNRAIASGRIPVKYAVLIFIILLVFSFVISAEINFYCLLTVILYLILNVLYSKWLKNIVLIDAVCIALGFIFRILSGCFAIKVLPSPLVILMTFFVSQFFTYTKRKLEIQLINSSNEGRKSVANIDADIMGQYILINAILSISFYITYVLDAATIQRAGTSYLYLTVIPFTLIVYRLFLLINTSKIEDDPIIYLEKDNTLKALFVFYIIVLAVVLTILK